MKLKKWLCRAAAYGLVALMLTVSMPVFLAEGGDEPKTEQPAGQSEGSQSEGGQSESGQSEGGQSEGGQSEGGQSEGGQSEGGQSEGGQSEGGQSEGGQSEGGQSEGGQSEGGQSEGGQSEGGQSEGGQSEGGQSEGGQSEGGQSEGGQSGGGSGRKPVNPTRAPEPETPAAPAATEEPDVAEGTPVSLTTGRALEGERSAIFALALDNEPDGRPQAAMSDADIVFEIQAGEDGSTTYLALYSDVLPETAGPAERLNPMTLSLAQAFSAQAVGAGSDGLAVDAPVIDALNGGSYFFRDTGRFAPHNVMTRIQKLASEINLAAPLTGNLMFGREYSRGAESATVFRVHSNPDMGYYPSYEFVPSEGVYYRYYNRRDNLDATGVHYTCANVIVMRYDGPWDQPLQGQGVCSYFLGGSYQRGTWRMTDGELFFYDEAGERIVLRRGKTFVHIVDNETLLEIAR